MIVELQWAADLLDRYPRQLSGGQRQRVAMGRAIVRDPQVFLFDEPLSNLDAKLRVAMRTEIKELHQRLKTTSVYVTHDQIEAMTMADQIVVMHDGTRLDAPPGLASQGAVDGQTVVFGTRPEHLTLTDAGGIAARVVVMEPTGMDTFVACRHAGVDLSAVFRERHDFAPGSTIQLLPDLQRAHLFDAGSGQRLAA